MDCRKAAVHGRKRDVNAFYIYILKWGRVREIRARFFFHERIEQVFYAEKKKQKAG
jgi:hypothetical protein